MAHSMPESAMSMRISVELLNGETLDLEVTGDMTISQLKQQIKGLCTWEDEFICDLTGELILKNDDTLADLGLSAGAKLSAMFRPNPARCRNQGGFGRDLDPEVPDHGRNQQPGSQLAPMLLGVSPFPPPTPHSTHIFRASVRMANTLHDTIGTVRRRLDHMAKVRFICFHHDEGFIRPRHYLN